MVNRGREREVGNARIGTASFPFEDTDSELEAPENDELQSTLSTAVPLGARNANADSMTNPTSFYVLPPPIPSFPTLEERKKQLKESMQFEIEDMKRKILEGAEKAAAGLEGWFSSAEVQVVSSWKSPLEIFTLTLLGLTIFYNSRYQHTYETSGEAWSPWNPHTRSCKPNTAHFRNKRSRNSNDTNPSFKRIFSCWIDG